MINRYDEINVEKVIEENLVNSDEFDSDSDWDLCSVYIEEELTEEDKLELINQADFEVVKDGDIFKLVDLQGANLADIESEEFETLDDIILRLDTYWYDYGILILDRTAFSYFKK